MTKFMVNTLMQLKQWPTPAVYNGLEAITQINRLDIVHNIEATTDFMPEVEPLVGYAATVVIEPGNPAHAENADKRWEEYRAYIADFRGPSVVVVQDLDKPNYKGAYWGEVNSNIHKALGCEGTIVDGAIRDIDEMRSLGFKVLAKQLCVGHAFSCPVRWNCEVEVFGASIKPGDLIHADKHGFIVIPEEDIPSLIDSIQRLDNAERNIVLSAIKQAKDLDRQSRLVEINKATKVFGQELQDDSL